MNKNITTYKTIIIEMFSIIIAVTLAFSLESWRENNTNENLGKTAFTDIIKELKENRKLIISRDSSLTIFITDIKEMIEKNLDDSDFSYNSILYDRSAWETSLLTNASRFISYKKLKDLKTIYSVIDLANSVNNKIVDILTSVDFYDSNRNMASKKTLLNNAQSLQSINKNIVRVIELILKKYDLAKTLK